jgi:DNA-binding transcriptional LysR family regulator
MQLDLNLLAALDALLEEGSVGAAADRLYVTSPAMSRTLGRIRKATGDQILVRTGRTMTPTPYALAVRAHVHDLVQQAQAVLSPSRELDLASLERTFTVRWQDTLVDACGPALLAAVRQAAPGVRLRFIAESSTDTPELRRGEVDLEANANEPNSPEIRYECVARARLAVAVRAGHPLTRGELTAERYASEADHVAVSRRGRLRDTMDELLAELGLKRHVVMSAPSGSSALRFARVADLVVTVPETAAHMAVAELGLVVLPLPIDIPLIPVFLSWHQRYDSDRAHVWLRGLARSALATVTAVPMTAAPLDGVDARHMVDGSFE